MSKEASDLSTFPSSTTMNIREFINNNDLDEPSNMKSSSSSSQPKPNTDTGSAKEKRKEVSFHFINQSLMKELDKFDSIKIGSDLERKISTHTGDINNTDRVVDAPVLDQEVRNPLDEATSEYQKKLKYLPNNNFNVDSIGAKSVDSISSPFSIPNTFEYKSHPNAKGKPILGRFKSKDSREGGKAPEENVVKMSPKQHDNRLDEDLSNEKVETILTKDKENSMPDWMPKELSEKWVSDSLSDTEKKENDFSASVRRYPERSSRDHLNMNFSSGSTMIHNSYNKQGQTPMWKRAAKEYENIKNSHAQLQNIFLTSDMSKKDSPNIDAKSHNFRNILQNGLFSEQNHSLVSTLSTPVPTFSTKEDVLNSAQSVSVTNIPETEYGKENLKQTGDGSPLKLFGNKYNTFTKDKLANLLQKINTGTPGITNDLIEKGNDADSMAKNVDNSRFKIRNFTKSKSYTEHEFLQNANTIFDNIQKRGFHLNKVSSSKDFKTMNSENSSTQNTNTSTPKKAITERKEKSNSSRTVDYSSFTSGFEASDIDGSNHFKDSKNDDERDSTSFENSSFSNRQTFSSQDSNNNIETYPTFSTQSPEVNDRHDNEDLTYDTIQSIENIERDNLPSSYLDGILLRLDNIESKFQTYDMSLAWKEIKDLKNENEVLKSRLQEIKGPLMDSSAYNMDTGDVFHDPKVKESDEIRWKEIAQLKLQKRSSSKGSPLGFQKGNLNRGMVNPSSDLPTLYKNMILDKENHRWISLDDVGKNTNGDLDMIEDLRTNSGDEYGLDFASLHSNESIEDKSQQYLKSDLPNAEVSFHLPGLKNKGSDENLSHNNITQVSQIGDVTFSQSNRKLINLITDVLSKSDPLNKVIWDSVSEISFSGLQLKNLIELDKLLPSLEILDLSNNDITFLDGLPKNILELKINSNKIGDSASFSSLSDLQILDVSCNYITNLSAISHNRHLTELNISNNALINISGMQNLSCLRKINIAKNNLTGEFNFKKYHLPNLEDLDVSDNKLTSVIGLEHVPNLRVLVCNENELVKLECEGIHKHLKKLVLKSNNLTRLNLRHFPSLRVLRIDGNKIVSLKGLKQLCHLEELSCKCQADSEWVNGMLGEVTDLLKLDLSGNKDNILLSTATNSLKSNIRYKPFLNLNRLRLCSMGLTKIPTNFAVSFPNVRDLNLNFNSITDISGLDQLENLKKLHLVSNCITNLTSVLASLGKARKTLKVLDLRLNPLNQDIYPYVFNATELDFIKQDDKITYLDSPIKLDTLEDIESFGILYESLLHDREDWHERDQRFVELLNNGLNKKRFDRRCKYEIVLMSFFANLVFLDGNTIFKEQRR